MPENIWKGPAQPPVGMPPACRPLLEQPTTSLHSNLIFMMSSDSLTFAPYNQIEDLFLDPEHHKMWWTTEREGVAMNGTQSEESWHSRKKMDTIGRKWTHIRWLHYDGIQTHVFCIGTIEKVCWVYEEALILNVELQQQLTKEIDFVDRYKNETQWRLTFSLEGRNFILYDRKILPVSGMVPCYITTVLIGPKMSPVSKGDKKLKWVICYQTFCFLMG